MIFGKESIYSKKERIETELDQNIKNEKNLTREISHLNNELLNNGEKKD